MFAGLVFCLDGCGKQKEENKKVEFQQEEPGEPDDEEIETVADLSSSVKKDIFRNNTPIHDAALFKDGSLYYAFGSNMSLASTTNLWDWELLASGVTKKNKLFDGLFDSDAFAWSGKTEHDGYSMWSPDIIYNSKMRKYCLYFSVSGQNGKDSICLAVSDHITGPYKYKDRVLDSGFTKKNASKTLAGKLFGSGVGKRSYFTKDGSYNKDICPSASDPCVFYDADGALWMVYGSGSGGIYIIELDQKTGLAVKTKDSASAGRDAYFGTHLLSYGDAACEAPYIFYNEETKFYYLFVSTGHLSSDGGYDIREYRSVSVDGPYLDSMGNSFLEETASLDQYGVKIMGNYKLPSNVEGYVSGGHPAVIADSDGRYLLIHHTRFDDGKEDYEIRVRQLFMNEAGWLCASPFNINNLKSTEKLKEDGYSTGKLLGTYYLINHGNEITADIAEVTAISLEDENVLNGITPEATWEKIDDTPYGNITINNQTYQGVFVKQKDEGNHDVMVFTGISDANNQQIWAVKYLELEQEGNGE